MKPFFLFCILLIAIAIKIEAQIPDLGFENWTTSGSCMVPQGWASINDWMGETENCYSMSRSDDHYPALVGHYSIKIENRISLLPDAGAGGMVWGGDSTGRGTDQPAFPITGHPTSLCGYYKFIPENGDLMDIHFALYKNGVEITGGGMKESTVVSEWTSFKIPVSSPDYAAIDSARIVMSSFDADDFPNVHGNSVLYVDNLSFDVLITAMGKYPGHNFKFNLYPNPASDHFILNIDKTYREEVKLEIYNAIGFLVTAELIKPNRQEINVADLSIGVYTVFIKGPKISEVQRLIIQH